MICSRCGFNNKEDSRFCIKCGQKIETSPLGNRTMSTDFNTGSFLQGRYRIIKQIGKGGMGIVYIASDNRFSNRICVVKEMIENLSDEHNEEKQKAIERFKQEADLLAAVSHPNIPQVYDRFDEGSRHYLVMEYIAGVDLNVVLNEYLKMYNGPLPEEDAVIYFMQLCHTLKYLHSYQPMILHRDIKPANILLTKDGKIKLVDFGIAKTIQESRQGTSIGTQGYAAPEQYKGLADARTDIYALGATMHYLLTGRDPQKQAPFDFPPVIGLNSKVKKDLSETIEWMLQMTTDTRPRSADLIINRLRQIYPDIEQRSLNYSIENNVIIEIIAKQLASKSEVGSQNLCRSCGYENKTGSRFCIKCGKPVSSSISLGSGIRNSADIKLSVPSNSRIFVNYPEGYGEYIKIPDKSGNIHLNVILERCVLDGVEYIYITEKLPSIVNQEVFSYSVVRNENGAMINLKPVTDPSTKAKLYSHWQRLL